MTLATRCPACGTVFRVVQDQLRVSQGWVRCGRCNEAFNAAETLVDLPPAQQAVPSGDGRAAKPEQKPGRALTSTRSTIDTAATSAANDAASPAPDLSPESSPSPGSAAPDIDVAAEPAPTADAPPPSSAFAAADTAAAALAADPVHAGAAPHMSVPEPAAGDDPLAAVPNRHDEAATGLASEPIAGAVASTTKLPPTVSLGRPATDTKPDAAPSFLRRAERAARWQHPAVRSTLLLLVLAGVLALLLQATYAFRDRIAAAAPALRPALQMACAQVGCRVGEFRQIDALSVESSGLVRVDGAPLYRLSLVLRNRAALEVAAPSVDLTLTDAQGKLIARRVLTMADLGLPLRTLKPGSELPIQASLGIGERPVSGYTVEIFYP